MRAHAQTIAISTQGKGTYEITREVAAAVRASGVQTGAVTCFIQHTSASLIIYENADRSARVDLERFFDELVPETTPYFSHTAEGPDDMPSHIRMILTRTSETIPVIGGEPQLGTWQGIFVFEHRAASHRRKIAVTVLGE